MLADIYPWLKAFHIISVIAWMAGIFYLPRLFVYHAETVGQTGETHQLFVTMEERLFRIIMTPAMAGTWIFGLSMAFIPGLIDWGSVWPWTKAASVVAMSGFHGWCGKQIKLFANGESVRDGRYYRRMNEVPTVLLIVIVISVIVRPL